VKVKLFGGLRGKVNASEVEGTGRTISEVLEGLSQNNAALGEAILEQDGRLRPHVRVMVNGLDSELKQGLATPVGEADEIAIFPPIAGGEAMP